MPRLILVTGAPGAGKSTLARAIVAAADALTEIHHLEADQYFVNEITGVYTYDSTKISDAHQWCRELTEHYLSRGDSVVVSNTFTRQWERDPYFEIAARTGAVLQVINVSLPLVTDEEHAALSIHGVPVETVAKMRQRHAQTAGA